MRSARIGEPLLVGLIAPQPLGDQPVHLLDARLLGVPDGVVVDGIWALRFSEVNSYIGATRGPDAISYRRHFHDVEKVLLDPRCPASARCSTEKGGKSAQDWYLAAALHIEQPGRFKTEGTEITYRVGTTKHTQRFTGWVIEIESGPLKG